MDESPPTTLTEQMLNRICSEYIEMPGLRLTCKQAQRLWGARKRAGKTGVVSRILSGAFAIVAWAASVGVASAQVQKPLERGMSVYTTQKCSACHAVGGRGNAKGALDDAGSRLSADEIRQWIINPAEMTKKTKAERKPAMRAYPTLSKDDVEALVAYVLSLKKK